MDSDVLHRHEFSDFNSSGDGSQELKDILAALPDATIDKAESHRLIGKVLKHIREKGLWKYDEICKQRNVKSWTEWCRYADRYGLPTSTGEHTYYIRVYDFDVILEENGLPLIPSMRWVKEKDTLGSFLGKKDELIQVYSKCIVHGVPDLNKLKSASDERKRPFNGPRASTVTLLQLLRAGKVKVDDEFSWNQDTEGKYVGRIEQNGSISCEALGEVAFSPHAFCTAVQRSFGKKGAVSAAEDGMINGVPLGSINDEYRKEKGMKTSTAAKRRTSSSIEYVTKRTKLNMERREKQREKDEENRQLRILEEERSDMTLVAISQVNLTLQKVQTDLARTENKIDDSARKYTVINQEMQLMDERHNQNIQQVSVMINAMQKTMDDITLENIRLNKESTVLREHVAVLESKPLLEVTQNLRREPYKKDSRDPDEVVKKEQNEIFVRETLLYSATLEPDMHKSVLYLDAAEGRTTTEFMSNGTEGLHFHIPNNSKSCTKLADLIEAKQHINVQVVPCELSHMLGSNYFTIHRYLISAWLDTTQIFDNVLESFKNLLTQRLAVPKSGMVVALTWSVRTSTPKFKNPIHCVEELEFLSKQRNASFSCLNSTQYYPWKCGKVIFVLGKLVFQQILMQS